MRAGTGRSLQSLLPAHLGHHVDPWLVWAVVMLVSPDSGTKSNIFDFIISDGICARVGLDVLYSFPK